MAKGVKCRNCNNLKHHWCERVIDSPDENMLRDCQYFWQRTNADRIRAMSDEELAEAFAGKCLCDYIPVHATGYCDRYRKCKDCVIEWLKQPAEVDNG